MISKILCFTAVLAFVAAEDHGHAFAYSSQHISRHDGHPAIVHVHGHGDGLGFGDGHGHGEGLGHGGHGHGHIDYHAYPKYAFEYKVDDPHTGDKKYQHEVRDGDHVKGVYSQHQPFGSERTVHYHGDHHTGFHADVKYDTYHVVPHGHHK